MKINVKIFGIVNYFLYLCSMLDENKKREWISKATTQSSLRYPRFKMKVQPMFNNNHKILFETMVANKKGNRLVYVMEMYEYSNYFENFNQLEYIKNRFLEKCKFTKDNYIFKKNTSIYEPYEFNK